MKYSGKIVKPDIVLGSSVDMLLCYNIVRAIEGAELGEFRREYRPDGAPAPTVNMRASAPLRIYEDYEGKKVLTIYRRRQLPTRDDVARYYTNYPRLVANLMDKDVFNVAETDVVYPYWISGRADHNPRKDPNPAVRHRDIGQGMEYKFDAKAFKAAGAKRIITFHPHFHRQPGVTEVEGIEVICLDLVPEMVKYGKDVLHLSPNTMVLNPDMKPGYEGKYCMAYEYARLAQLDCNHLEKCRVSGEVTETKTKFDAKGRDVLIVDDIGSTFTTINGAVQNIKNPGGVHVIIVHPVLPARGHALANEMISRDDYRVRTISAFDTIDSDFSEIPIHPAIINFYENGTI
jgi:phosphoribosylpyrophosphate synthetase